MKHPQFSRRPTRSQRHDEQAHYDYIRQLNGQPRPVPIVALAAPAPVVPISRFTELMATADEVRSSWGSAEDVIADAARCLSAAIEGWASAGSRRQVVRAYRTLNGGER